jgi:hypothetical protein
MPSTTKQSTKSASTAPAAPVLKQRQRTPSVMTPLFAAIAQDVTTPKPQVSATPTVATAAASATAPQAATQPIPTTSGAVPVVTTSDTTAGVVPVVAIPPPAPNVVGPPPSVISPTPPAGFVMPGADEYSGYHPSSKELAAASTVVADLLTPGNDYAQDFGSRAPSVASVAKALQVALAWRDLRGSADAWDRYVRAEDGLAWKAAMLLLDQLKPIFLIAVAQDPELATQYAGLAQMFGAPKLVAQKSSATKKQNAKTRAVADAAAAQAAAVSSAVAAATAPATPAKTVTVSV